jgi:hypothetical protein
MNISEIVTGLFKPLTSIFQKREERKAAREAAASKLSQAKVDQAHTIELKKDEWEQLAVSGLDKTWKDEYITVSLVSIFNLIVLGGILAAFGFPQLLTGVGIAIQALTTAGVDVGFLLTATVMAGLGLSIWKKF